MIEINDIIKLGDSYLIKYFADGITQEMETPVDKYYLLALIRDNSLNKLENNEGKQYVLSPIVFLEENIHMVCKLYLSQQPEVTMTISGKLFDRYVDFAKRKLRIEMRRCRHTSPEPNRKMYIEAIISEAEGLELDLDFIEELKRERV